MKNPHHPKIAFVGWNPFQFLHFRNVASLLPGASLLIEDRKGDQENFDFSQVAPPSATLIHRNPTEMRDIDGEFDILVCQTPFAGIENIRTSKIAMLQYGYAKEAHNFAPWRSFADVCMTFGDYASRKIEPYCPCVATGNPRYGEWKSDSFHSSARQRYCHLIDPHKPTILYAPTWGALSSFNQFQEAISDLAKDYNVIFKIHHNSLLRGANSSAPTKSNYTINCDTRDDIVELLAVCDLMISDYSGAIFDAIFCEIPVLLLDQEVEAYDSISDRYSIERERRNEIGARVSTPSDLAAAVHITLSRASKDNASISSLRANLFSTTGDPVANAAKVISDLAAEAPPRTQQHQYLRKEMRDYYRCRAELSAWRSLPGFLKMAGNQLCKKIGF
jgi:hypothetical protein